MKVIIGYQEYDVVLKDEIYHKNELVNGLIDSDNDKIYVQDSDDSAKKQHIFLYEVLHGIADMFHLDLTETEIDLMALGLLMLKRDNP
jgi:hypothetical protein